MSEWHNFTDREALDHSLTAYIVSKLALGIAARGAAYLVVSGGSTPVNLFSLLSASHLDWKNVVVLLADSVQSETATAALGSIRIARHHRKGAFRCNR